MPGILTSSYYLEYGRQKKLSDQRTLITQPLKKGGIKTAGFHSNPHLSSYFGWNRDWGHFFTTQWKQSLMTSPPYIKALHLNLEMDRLAVVIG